MSYDSKSKKKQETPVWTTERGLALLDSHNNQQNNNPFFKREVVIKVDGEDKKFTIGQKCPVCKHRIRGVNHCEGDHHKKR